MKFWDASALIPLLLTEPSSAARETVYAADPEMTIWFFTPVECASAISRRQRQGKFPVGQRDAALNKLQDLSPRWQSVAPVAAIRDEAMQLLERHPLSSADALQLAAALAACGGDPASLDFVCSDVRLAEAARREGFPVIP